MKSVPSAHERRPTAIACRACAHQHHSAACTTGGGRRQLELMATGGHYGDIHCAEIGWRWDSTNPIDDLPTFTTRLAVSTDLRCLLENVKLSFIIHVYFWARAASVSTTAAVCGGGG